MANTVALLAVEKFLGDVVEDAIHAAEDSNASQKLLEFTNLLPDALALVPLLTQIGSEAVSLEPADYAALVAQLAIDMSLPAGKVANIVKACLKTLEDLLVVFVPDVEAIVQAAKS